MRIRQVVAASDRGTRSHNEDAVLRLPKTPLFAVADGMGGPGGGDLAANIALQTIERNVDEIAKANGRVADTRSPADRLALGRLLDRVFNEAAREIQRESARLQRPGIGSTVLMCTFARGFAYIAHVGDSRAYLLRNGRLQQLTEDHTVAELAVRRGRMTRDQALRSPERRVLYQSLGAGLEVDGDLAEVRVGGGDVLILCTDGLPRALDDDEVIPRIDGNDLETSAQRLIKAARQAGAPDNVTMVLISFESEPGDDAPDEGVRAAMRGLFLFRDMTDAELLTIAPYLEEVVYEKDVSITAEGDVADEFCVVVSGSVRVSRGRTALHDVKAGGHFGELALSRDQERSLTVRTLSPTRLLVLSRARFHDLVRQKPELGTRITMALLDTLGQRVSELSERLNAVERAVRGELR